MQPLGRTNARCLWLAPYCRAESDPDWQGTMELRDCEVQKQLSRRFGSMERQTLVEHYHRHFDFWERAAVENEVDFLRVLAGVPLEEELTKTPRRREVFEVA